ncbi:MAG: hypothetical protein ABFC96_17180 [Thermoguttaceae bacterium]
MAMVRLIRCSATLAGSRRFAGRMAVLVLWSLGAAATLVAQQPSVHYLHHGVMPPGAIGSTQLQRGGPLPGYYQPVEIKAPTGALISLAVDHQFDESQPAPRKAGFLIGSVYRLRLTKIHMAEGAEVFPTIEVIDRLYPPPGQECRFAIPIEITEEDLRLAIDGKFVTRVIYLEDPQRALPARDNPQHQTWFEAAPGQDPLAVADGLGRPVAILRLGGRVPDQGQDSQFYFGSPPWLAIPREKAAPRQMPVAVAQKSANVSAQKPAGLLPQKPFDGSSPKPAQPQVKLLPPPPELIAPQQNNRTTSP